MKKNTIRLLMVAASAYYAVLFVTQGFQPDSLTAPLFLLVFPMMVLVVILASNLSSRATVPTEVETSNPPSRKLSRQVEELARRIEVATTASDQYFENALLARLREILAEKVALETGLEMVRIRETLANRRLGPDLLRDDMLYRLLYSRPPARGPERVKLLQEAVARVEAWKP